MNAEDELVRITDSVPFLGVGSDSNNLLSFEVLYFEKGLTTTHT